MNSMATLLKEIKYIVFIKVSYILIGLMLSISLLSSLTTQAALETPLSNVVSVVVIPADSDNVPVASTPSAEIHPALVANGEALYAVWEADGKIYLSKSADGGSQWEASIELGSGASPALCMTSSGMIGVVWGGGDVYFTTVPDGEMGPTPGAPQSLGTGFYPDITANADGNFYVVWQEIITGVDAQPIWLRKSLDDGTTFEPPVQVGQIVPEKASPPKIAVNAHATPDIPNVYVVWSSAPPDTPSDFQRLYLAVSHDGGDTFEQQMNPTAVETRLYVVAESAPDIAAYNTDTLYLVWHEEWTSGAHVIQCISSADAGGTFGDIIPVSTSDAASPSLAVDTRGILYVAWGEQDIYYSRSLDDGLSFSSPLRIDDAMDETVQNQPTIAVDANGRVNIAWVDERYGDKDIYTVVPHPPDAPQGLTAIADKAVIELNWEVEVDLFYNVYRGTTSGQYEPTPLNSIPIAEGRYVDAEVTAGTMYYYVVTALDILNWESIFSVEVPQTPNAYTITPSVVGNGSIFPATPVIVGYGANQTFTFTPDKGHHVMDIKVDGVSVDPTPTDEYTFTYVTQDHSIDVTFTLLGDVDDDGDIDAMDAVRVLQYLIDAYVPSDEDWFLKQADVSGQMGVTAYDAALIFKRSLDEEFPFPAETSSVIVMKRFRRISRQLTFGPARRDAHTITVPLRLDRPTSVVALQMRLRYAPTALRIRAIQAAQPGIHLIHKTHSDQIDLVLVNNGTALRSDALAYLTFEILGGQTLPAHAFDVVSAQLNESEVSVVMESLHSENNETSALQIPQIAGRVTHGSKSLPNSTVEAWNTEGIVSTLQTDPQGRFDLALAMQGSLVEKDIHHLRIYAEGYFPVLVPAERLTPDMNIDLTSIPQVQPTSYYMSFYGMNSSFQGQPLQRGDVITVMDPNGVTAGVAVVQTTGQYGYMLVYGDDPLTEADEGAVPGDVLTFSINNYLAGTSGIDSPPVWADYARGEVDVFTWYTEIPLQKGWNLAPVELMLHRSQIQEALTSIEGKYEVVQGREGTFAPALPAYSDLSTLTCGETYWIKLKEDATLVFTGTTPPSPVEKQANHPPLQIDLWGDVRIYGTAAPVGTVITAHAPDGEEISRTVVKQDGQYGFLHLDSSLLSYPDAPVRLKVDGVDLNLEIRLQHLTQGEQLRLDLTVGW